MDNEELASFFAEKLKWEEKESQYKEKESQYKQKFIYTRKMLLEHENFLSRLSKKSYFFGSGYRKIINKFKKSMDY